MRDLADLIRYERENSGVDFKKQAYTKPQHLALLKDVLSMANADVADDRFIVCGVWLKQDGSRELVGVPENEFVDEASYQQLVLSNIEPDIQLAYFPYEIENKKVGVFCISHCTQQPYAMRKTFWELERGEIWIRKGSQQMRASRSDIERMYQARAAAHQFTGPIKISFADSDDPVELQLPTAEQIVLRSDEEAAEIQEILTERRAAREAGQPELRTAGMLGPDGSLFYPYMSRTTRDLEKLLERLPSKYADEDAYELYELYGHSINFELYNDGLEHLEDARFEVDVPKIRGLAIATKVHRKPMYIREPFATRRLPEIPVFGYPSVQFDSEGTHIVAELDDLRHKARRLAFDVPIRIVIGPSLVGSMVLLRCTLRGKNLQHPITQELGIRVVPPDGTLPRKDEDGDEEDDE